MENLTFEAACEYLGKITTPETRTANAVGRITAEVALERERAALTHTSRSVLAECAHDLLVLLDETDPPVTRDERIGHAIDRLDQLVARVRLAPGESLGRPAVQPITK